jgi:hypothetical protein
MHTAGTPAGTSSRRAARCAGGAATTSGTPELDAGRDHGTDEVLPSLVERQDRGEIRRGRTRAEPPRDRERIDGDVVDRRADENSVAVSDSTSRFPVEGPERTPGNHVLRAA